MTRSILVLALSVLGAFVFAGCSSDEPAGAPGSSGAKAGKPANTGGKATPEQGKGSGNSGAKEPEVKMNRSAIAILFKEDPPYKKERKRPAQIALGRKLYHDKRLSKNGDISCASCHDLKNYGQDGKATSPGTGGAAGTRNSPSTLNASRQLWQFWDYRAKTIEDQAVMPLLTAHEHGLQDEAELVKILEGAGYVDEFKKAFPKEDMPISAKTVGKALGNFQRQLRTTSRWDKYVEGDDSALSNQEKRGLKAFMDTTCTTCHSTRMLGGSVVQKMGLIRPVELADKGRFEVTKSAGDTNMFKVPSLLNVAKTGPYLHDGSQTDLEEVLRYMVKHQVAVPVSEQQIKDMMAFLLALTGELVDPSLAEPPPAGD